ncbi:MAG: 3-hydroxybutyryl-CoA dehydrogenase, partial [Deltaproteobacteria bacterium]|nr:3-hydroxybutyryl-CoA dehydrogenase [Deltaproteobacteria bacterium]
MDIKKVCIVGAGIMGSGIAQIGAQAGYQVVVRDVEERFLEKGMAAVRRSLERAVSKEIISSEDAAAVLERIRVTVDLEDAGRDADYVIEAVTEVMEIKKEVFYELDTICKPEAIFASNTSGLSITEMAAATRRPERFIGLHFFNPVPVMRLVEIIRGFLTSAETLTQTRIFVESLGKSPIEVKEAPGFAVNRILCPMINEAIFVYSEGIASAEDIDQGMVLGANHPMGP